MNTSNLVDTLALSLLHFLWQGAAIAALAGALMLVLRRPATRYVVGVGALVLMLVSFGTTVALLSGSDSVAALTTARAPAAALASPKVADVSSLSMLWTSQAANSSDAFVWLARAWFAGVLVFALRIVAGLLAIERLRRRSLGALPAPLVARFEALQARLGIDRVIRYCQCEGVSVPAVIGIFRPIVLLPMRALTGLSAEQIDAVVAHELGHILRFDVAVNFLQVIAETLLFFHPAVWWLNRRIRADREDCCDDVAVSACGDRVTYVRALATLEGWRGMPTLAMAATGGTVAARVARLLGMAQREPGERASRAVAAMLVLTAALAAGTLALGLSQSALAQSEVAPTPAPIADEKSELPSLQGALPLPPVPEMKELPPVPDVPPPPAPLPRVAPPAPPLPVAPPEAAIEAIPAQAAEPALPPEPADPAEPAREPKAPKEPKATKEPKAPKEPKADKEPKFAKEPKAAKEPKEPKVAKEPRVSLEPRVEAEARSNAQVEVESRAEVEVATHEVFEVHEAVQENRNGNQSRNDNQSRNSDVDVNVLAPGDLIFLKRAGIPKDYVRGILSTGLHAQLEDLILLRSHDVSPEYISQMRALGMNGDARKFAAMKSQDVSPGYLQALIDVGIRAGADEAMRARAMGVTPDAMRHAQQLGFRNLTVDKLIQLQIADVL